MTQSNLKALDATFESNRPVGLLAGWGNFPFAVAEAMREAGLRVAGVGILDHCDPRLEDLCDHFDWIGIGGIGKAIRHFKSWGVDSGNDGRQSAQGIALSARLVA